ncbi:MAG TPA: alcohol dehydrogenase catalytic domain-containing protein [Frankiaceae bacterium]|nr:alcohol dehydrogenase catalytic domain-containing protein [Frankiaceae bacterium]
MKAVVLGAGGTLTNEEVPDPAPGPGEVRLRVAACGVCGTDLHLRGMGILPPGYVMGHEFAGVVDAVGAGVTGWAEGDRAAVYPFVPSPVHDMAASVTGIGCGGPAGGLAEAAVVGADRLWRLPAGLDTETGALVEPLAVALHALDVGGVRPDDPCAVVGAGPIGMLVALALRARGVTRLAVVEPNAARRARVGGAAFGLEGVHDNVLAALGEPPRVVFECAGHPSAPGLALELVAPSGVVVLLGVLDEPVPISQLLLMVKEAQLRASFCYRPASFDEAVGLLADGAVRAGGLVTSRRPLAEAPAVLDLLATPGSDEVKVLLVP